jgi:hypothetical protein
MKEEEGGRSERGVRKWKEEVNEDDGGMSEEVGWGMTMELSGVVGSE